MTLAGPTLDHLAIDTIRTLSIDGVQKANSGPPGRPDGRRADGLHALDALPPPRPVPPRLAGPRPLRPVGRPRLDAPLLAPPPHGLRRHARGPQVVPAVGLEDAGPPGVRPHAGRRGDDRAARPGLRERRRHGDRRAAARGRVQPARPRRSSTTGRTRSAPTATSRRASRRRRRRSPATSGSASSSRSTTTTASSSTGRPTMAWSEDVLERFDAYGWHTQRVEDGNDIEAIARGDRRRRARTTRPIADRSPDPHRLRQPEPPGHPEGPRPAARRRRGPARQGGLRLGPRQATSTSRTTRSRALPRGGRRPARRSSRRGRGDRRLRARPPGPRGGAPAPRLAGRLADGWDAGLKTYADGEEVATRNASQDAIQALAGPVPELFGGAADLSRIEPDRRQGRRRLRARRARPERLVRRPRARDGRRRERDRLPRRVHPVRRHVPDVQRLHARLRPARGAERPPRDLRLDPRLGRAGRGRPDPPAGRALRGAAGDPQPVVRPARRRERGGGGVGGGARARRRVAVGPGRAVADPPEAADAAGHGRAGPRRRRAAAATSCARRAAARPRDRS